MAGQLAVAALCCLRSGARAQRPVDRAPAWTRGAVCYEVFVRSFFDSNGDGVGDLRGLIAKLDYINDGNPHSTRSLGASCIWLMPVMPSPSYHGYDVTDYYGIQPAYGTLRDFAALVAAAHRRGIHVLIDMVLNHTSDRHPDFQAALRDTTSPYRAWYRFSPVPLGPGPWGEDAWHKSPLRDEYYYGVFTREMPDLNYHTPAVRTEAMRIADFWLRRMHVDGFRLDAVPYLVESAGCQIGCPGTHEFLADYAAHLHHVDPDAYTVGEVWGNIATLMPYYPDQLTSYFGFELADSLIAAVRNGSGQGLLSGFLRLQAAEPWYRWSPLLSNHDGTRSFTLLGGDLRRARLAATLLLTLPGLPFVYYGEELGMPGDKPDPRLRTPMPWSDGAGAGFTTGTPWESLQPGWQQANVASESADSTSLLNRYRQLIHLRRENAALGVGQLVPLDTRSDTVIAYLRRSGGQSVIVVANLGASADSTVRVEVPSQLVPAGNYRLRDLLAGQDAGILRISPTTRSPFTLRGVAAREARILALVRQ